MKTAYRYALAAGGALVLVLGIRYSVTDGGRGAAAVHPSPAADARGTAAASAQAAAQAPRGADGDTGDALRRPVQGPTLAAALPALVRQYEGLGAEDQKTVRETAAYMKLMNDLRPIMDATVPPHLTPAQVLSMTQQVRALQGQNYFTLSEAFEIESRLLATQYSGTRLQMQVQALQQDYQQQYQALAAQSDPGKDPANMAYKGAQSSMLEEAKQMRSFPDGMTREEYIIQQNEKIRAKYYP